jgi:hypothetical protein
VAETALEQLNRGLGLVEDAINRLAKEHAVPPIDLIPLRWGVTDLEEAARHVQVTFLTSEEDRG